MSVGLLPVTHDDIGAQMSRVASAIHRHSIEPVALVSTLSDLRPENLGEHADRVREAMLMRDSGDGVLALTDAYGTTPDNPARYFAAAAGARVVSGINLPMLLRVLNYAQQPLEELGRTALAGGREGVCRAANDF